MAPQVNRRDMSPKPQRRQDGLVGNGIEAIGMNKQAVDGAHRIAKGNPGQLATLYINMKPAHSALAPKHPSQQIRTALDGVVSNILLFLGKIKEQSVKPFIDSMINKLCGEIVADSR